MQKCYNSPPPPEVEAINYGSGFVEHLRCQDGWRSNAVSLIYRELESYVRLSVESNFGLQDMWDYGQLVEVIDHYLHHRQNEVLTERLYIKVCRDLRGVNALLKKLPFDEWEKRSMREAFAGMVPTIKGWRAKEEARE